jgi:hypothetical protein
MKFGHSGCIMCPFRSDEEWLEMQRNHPEDFKRACQYDESIRSMPGIKGEGYLHDSLTPLRSIDFEALIKERAGDFSFSRDCGGSECRT